MRLIRVTEDALASILVMDRRLEEYPEPYRSNKDIDIEVSFETYKKFIDDYLDVHDYLATRTTHLRYYLLNGMDDMLCRCFYLDMAMAVAKELWYTDISEVPTGIHHVVEEANCFDKGYVDGLHEIFTSELSRAQNKLMSHLKTLNYQLAPAKVVKFKKEMDYATLLYAMSSPGNEYGVGFNRWSFERSDAYGNNGDIK